MLGQLGFDLVLAWLEVEAELIIAARHFLARNPWPADHGLSLDHPHNCARVMAAKCNSASYQPHAGPVMRGCAASKSDSDDHRKDDGHPVHH
jgi:hypothetical protein